MADIRTLPISKIHVGPRLRPVDFDQVETLAASIALDDMINPITVYYTPNRNNGDTPFTLIAGASRLAATSWLGRDVIEVNVIKATARSAERLEISENLFRHDLPVLERALLVARYRSNWEAEFGPVKAGRPAGENGDNMSRSFVAELADQFKISPRTVKRLDMIARRLVAELRDILRGTKYADNQAKLIKCAKLETEKQVKVTEHLRSGMALDAAFKEVCPGTGRMEPAEWRRQKAREHLTGMTAEERKALLAEFGFIPNLLSGLPEVKLIGQVVPTVSTKNGALWQATEDSSQLIPPPLDYNKTQKEKAKLKASEKEAETAYIRMADIISAQEAEVSTVFQAEHEKARAKQARKVKKALGLLTKHEDYLREFPRELRQKMEDVNGHRRPTLIEACGQLGDRGREAMMKILYKGFDLDVSIQCALALLNSEERRGNKAYDIEMPLVLEKKGRFRGLLPQLVAALPMGSGNRHRGFYDGDSVSLFRTLSPEVQQELFYLLEAGASMVQVRGFALLHTHNEKFKQRILAGQYQTEIKAASKPVGERQVRTPPYSAYNAVDAL